MVEKTFQPKLAMLIFKTYIIENLYKEYGLHTV